MKPVRKLLLAALLANACAYADEAFLNAKLNKGDRRIRSVLILPAEVAISRGQGFWDKSDAFEDGLTELAAKTLSGHGSRILKALAGPDDPEEARDAARELQEKFDAIDAQLWRRASRVVRGHYSLGDSVAAYALTAPVDTIVFLRGSGTVPASSLGGSAFDGRMTFVDAHSGNVLAYIGFICNSHDWSENIDYLGPHIIDDLDQLRVRMFDLMGEKKRH